ncbi:MFS transporter [Silvimonas iriomotensis]|uniref:ABC transporter permease n=1 Tax=Silvimonas iriomotensis TaxID=449662 RepID=A0ABQ2PDR8_9NEIS|nr:MFS transporter [Silvimonas iriomotensis]GGP23407.1 ABC transporter permease [Silvimonas iriomotensis]
MTTVTRPDWRAIFALTSVSSLAQIGQFGFGFMVLPLWLADHALDPARAGLFASLQWAGMLVGLLGTPWLGARVGPRYAVLAGLLVSVAGFALMPWVQWPWWLLSAFLIGAGLGMRWIANESWLYGLVPPRWSGRVVGAHETLISLAEIIAPTLALLLGSGGNAPFIAGIVMTLIAAPPLWLAPQPHHHDAASGAAEPGQLRLPTVQLGLATALVGGLCAGALYGLFPQFATAHQFSAAQTATLLTILGVGAMVWQIPVGWLADRAGLAGAVLAASVAALIACVLLLAGSTLLIGAGVFLLGGVSAAFLTLAVYAAATRPAPQIARVMRWITVSYTGASIIGPLGAGVAMKTVSADALVWQEAALTLLLAVAALVSVNRVRARTGAAA